MRSDEQAESICELDCLVSESGVQAPRHYSQEDQGTLRLQEGLLGAADGR